MERAGEVIWRGGRDHPAAPQPRRYLQVAKNKDGESNLNMLLDFDGDKQCFRKSNAQPKPETAPEQPVQQSMFRPIHAGGPTPFDKEERK